jgi:hypothetical protein
LRRWKATPSIPQDQYQCVPAIQIGNVTFHNWKKSDRGALNFVQALTNRATHGFIRPA